ncbi:serine/arginine repetitive matrix protein 2 [Nocardioides sp. zg-536]|uniref:Serine/arginine repetitive matrix protein 2 n=1 Tax=Nocardioides faecalis TaxID=2803858 RepID=A0A938Y5R4_9ACTN|nr:ArdC-like ssDNA-binding domain-containing protein [Nocardioides faecalis]MBM9458753.1 serine/arginine repetitive matrix protein 2 [Nocardioides faecalis]QVI60171.1 serine/arginine repetitive matrix protein 2 [Nocardioides faecalis]
MTTQVRGRAAREAKLEALQEQLSASVAALVSGKDWNRALTFAAQFRGRGFGNCMLIAVQHFAAYNEGRVPETTPTYVAGFHQWLSLGRSVAKGQHGYGILAPVTGRFASFTPNDPNSWRRLARNEKPMSGEYARTRVIGVKPTYVWDISQTTGNPVPELPRPTLLQGQAPAGLWDGLADQITSAGFELRLVSSASAIGGANGLTDFLSRGVSIRVDMDEAAQVKTLAHELGHVLLHAPPESALSTESAADATLHRGIAEVEAESVALMVGAAHGLDTSSYTVPYVSTWAASVLGNNPVEVVQSTAERVRASARPRSASSTRSTPSRSATATRLGSTAKPSATGPGRLLLSLTHGATERCSGYEDPHRPERRPRRHRRRRRADGRCRRCPARVRAEQNSR